VHREDISLLSLPADDPGASLQQSQEQWRGKALSFLSQAKADEKIVEKVVRVPTYKNLCALDHCLVASTGFGLSAFRPAPLVAASSGSADTEPGLGKQLNLVIDQDSKGFSGAVFLLYCEKLRLNLIFDPFHRTWNDIKLAYQASGVWDVVLLLGTAFNVNFGPWDGEGWWRQTEEAAHHYAKVAGSSCPLWQALWPKICQEQGVDLMDHEAEVSIREGLLQSPAVKSKGPKFAACRWFSWHDCFSHWARWRSQRTLVWMHLGLSLGYVTQQPGEAAIQLKQLVEDKKVEEGTEKPTMAAASKKDALRSRCQNTLHMATLLWSDDELYRRGLVMHRLSLGIREWHGKVATALRSPGECIAFHADMATGSWVATCSSCFDPLRTLSSLASLGFQENLDEVKDRRAATERLAWGGIEDETKWAKWAVHLAFNLVRARVRSCMYHSVTFPGRAAALLSEDEEQVDACLSEMKLTEKAWVELGSATSTFLQNLKKRSCLQWTVTDEFFRLAKSVSFREVPAELRGRIQESFALAQTKVVEDAFGASRDVETRGQKHKRMTPMRRWQIPILSGTLSENHNFTEVPWEAELATVADTDKWSDTLFKPETKVGKTSMDLSQVTSKKPKESWPTFTPGSISTVWADLVLLRHLFVTKTWAEAHNSWLSCLLPEGVLCRHPTLAEPFFSLGSVQHLLAIGWPADMVIHNGTYFYAPGKAALLGDLVPLIVTGIGGWEVQRVQWRGPIHGCITKRPATCPLGAEAQGAWIPLVEAAAREAFYELGAAPLKRLMTFLHVPESGVPSTVAGKLEALVRHCLPFVSHSEVHDILAKRLTNREMDSTDLLADPHLRDCIDKGDWKHLDEFAASVEQERKDEAEIRAAVKKLSAVVASAIAAASSSAGAKASASGKKSAVRKIPPPPKGVDMSEDEARSYLPTGARLFKDIDNGRWRVSCPTWGNLSRSWTLHGSIFAFAQCCIWAWRKMPLPDDQPCPHAWVVQMAGEGI
jgi:hypothetical protein